MNATIKFHLISKIEDNCDGTVIVHYQHSLAVTRAINTCRGQGMDKLVYGTTYKIVVMKGDLVDLYA